MAKFSGVIGFTTTEETSPGVWTDTITERHYTGDLNRHSRRWDSSGNLHDNIVFSQDISIIADPYLNTNLHNMIYVTYRGIKWRIKDFDINYPRVTISMGGEWHGNSPISPD